MTTKEEYKSAFEIMENVTYSSFKYTASPNFNVVDGIKLTLQNAISMNAKEWEMWYATYKNNYEVLCAGLSTKVVPKNIVDTIINNLDIIKNHSYDRNKWSDKKTEDIAIIKEALKNDISKTSFNKIISEINNDIFVFLGFTSGEESVILKELSNDALNFLALKSIHSFATEDFYSPFHTSGPEAVAYVRDEKFLKKVMSENNIGAPININEGQKEKIRSMVVNNENMSDDFRNEMFENGCDWTILKADSFTPEIIENGYLGAIDTFAEVYDFDKKTSKSGFGLEYQECTILLTRLVETGQLPEHFEIDLANRLIQRGERNSDILTDAFLQNTKNEKVLNMVKKFKNQDQLNIYDNPNVPETLLKERVDELFKKIVKDLDKGRKLTQSWLEQIGDYSHKIQLTNEQYKFLFTITPKEKMVFDFILSEKTPVNILEEFRKEAYNTYGEVRYNGGVPVAIDTVLFMKENNFPKEFMDAVKKCVEKESRYSYINNKDELISQIKQHPDFAKKLLDFYYERISKPIEGRYWDSKKDKDIFRSLYRSFSNEYNFIKQKDEYWKTGCLKTMDYDAIRRFWHELTNDFTKDKTKIYEGTLLLDKFAKDINTIYADYQFKEKEMERKMFKKDEDIEKIH